MDNIIRNSDGSIDWEANGWPEPNPYGMTDGYDIEDMPDDIFEIWQEECEAFDDWNVDE